MRIALVMTSSRGMSSERDEQVLRGLFGEAGQEAVIVGPQDAPPPGPFDLVIFYEVVVPSLMNLAVVRWLMPTPEKWLSEWTPLLGLFDSILCKTRDAQRAFGRLGAHTIYTGFRARDRFDSAVPRERRFLHIADDSTEVETAGVLEAWRKYRLKYPLTIVSSGGGIKKPPKAVQVVEQITDAELRIQQNTCLFAIQPSSPGGFGHTLHEALSCGALIATADAAPMNEMDGVAALIPPTSFSDQRLARTAHVDAAGVREAVTRIWGMNEAAVAEGRERARSAYDESTDDFEMTFLELLRTVRPTAQPTPQVTAPAVPIPGAPTALAMAMTVNNRPGYLQEVLTSLSNNRFLDSFTLHFGLEPGNKEVARVCEKTDFISKQLHVNRHHLGDLENPYQLLTRTFEMGYEAVLYLEDDVVLAPDAVDLALWYLKQTALVAQTSCLCLYNTGSGEGGDAARVVVSPPPAFSSLGFVITKAQWQVMQPLWHKDGRGWDWGICFGGRVPIAQPCVSRSHHIGRQGGTHYVAHEHDPAYVGNVMYLGPPVAYCQG